VKTIAYIALGGAIGALTRYGVGLFLKPESTAIFPIHTFVINLTGSFLIGIATYMLTQLSNTAAVQLFVITGILGGFTTFSSFSIESVQLIQQGKFIIAGTYITLSTLLGITMAWIGFSLPKLFIA
jgi:CrcB protein